MTASPQGRTRGARGLDQVRGALARLRAVVGAPRPSAPPPPPRQTAVERPAGRAPRPPAATAAPPLLSVVIPVYDVERYLAECLDSVLTQTYPHLEVIVVDDGSPDSSYDIARAYADRDPRLRIVRQANAGLSGARNAGTALATGTYLTFLDSDDRLQPEAYALLVGSLERTGSDFAVGCYRRFDGARSWPAAWWIRDAHAQTRHGVRLEEHWPALVNAVAWSKVYRRSFFVGQGLVFPQGVLYEDQAVSATAYARASRFDLLSAVTHEWRVREDASSISQQVRESADLRARLEAAHASLAVLAAEAGPEAVRARRTQLLSHDLPASIAEVPRAGDEFWELLVRELGALAGPADDALWAEVPTGSRTMAHLVMQRQRDELVDFLDASGRDTRTQRTHAADGRVVAELPLSDAVPADVRGRLSVLAPLQTKLFTSVRRVRWSGPGWLEVDAWAYVENVDLADVQPEVTVRLREQRTGAELVLPVLPVHEPAVMRMSGHQYCDLRRAPFRVRIDAEELVAASSRSGDWAAVVEVEVAGLRRSGLLRGVDRAGSAGEPRAQVQVSGGRVQPVHSPDLGLVLEVRRPALLTEDLTLQGRTLSCCVRVRSGGEPVSLLARHNVTGEVWRGEVARSHEVDSDPARSAGPEGSGDLGGLWTARLELGRPMGVPGIGDPAVADTGAVVADSWALRLVDAADRERPLSWPATSDDDRVDSAGDRGLSAVRSRAGNVTLVDAPDLAVVRAVTVLADGLELEVVLRGSSPEPPSFSLRSTRLGVEPRSIQRDGDTLRMVLPLEADEWGFGAVPLPIGDYLLVASRPTPEGGVVQVPTEVEPQVVTELPLNVDTERLRGRLERQSGRLRLRVDRPLDDEERGAFFQRCLQDHYRTSSPRPERAVLFRTYYGESATDSALAVHEELRRRGAPVTLYWTVRDHSVIVPEGGVPVVQDSARWYEVLRDATYVIDNMHQPAYFTKHPHQVVVATMHGYPFKSMGHPHWDGLGFTRARIRSFDERAAQWDHLVSPASYATPLLQRDFRYDGSVLAIGYPRNDVLLRPEAVQVRDATRRRLGLAEDAQVVLYAPTFRDALSTDDHRAPMVDHLDMERLLAGLGDDAVLLVRGHAFNARMSTRLERSGRLIDVTDYPFVNDLYLAADALVADYSSLRFDFALTGKPMVFLVPDLDDYRDAGRGWLFDFGLTAPGPRVALTDEVVEALRDPEHVHRQYADAYAAFRRDFLDLEDGHAAERLVDAVLVPRGDADRVDGTVPAAPGAT